MLVQTRVSELSGRALDWAVASCYGGELARANIQYPQCSKYYRPVSPSTDWDYAGKLITDNGINILRTGYFKNSEQAWAAYAGYMEPETSTEHQSHDPMYQFYVDGLVYGSTPLIAAMRCYVRIHMGKTMLIPESLIQGT